MFKQFRCCCSPPFIGRFFLLPLITGLKAAVVPLRLSKDFFLRRSQIKGDETKTRKEKRKKSKREERKGKEKKIRERIKRRRRKGRQAKKKGKEKRKKGRKKKTDADKSRLKKRIVFSLLIKNITSG